MKIIKSMTFAVLALASAGTAYSAATTVRIVASNGDRTATQTAISHLLDSGWTFQGTGGNTSSSGTLSIATNANFGAWHGFYSGDELIIKVSYSGALAGISAIAGNTDQKFVLTDGTGTGSVSSPLTGAAGVTHEVAKADFGFSTNFQSTSPFNGVYQGVTYNTVIEEIVGVSPLGFYASPGFPAAGANLTTQLAQQLYKSGSLSAQLFTGDANDLNKTVWAIGRNTDAGQRFGAYTEIGLGTSSVVTVWQPTLTGQSTTAGGIKNGGTATSHVLWPAESPSGIVSPKGSGGYSSGALLAEPLTAVLGPNAYKGAYVDDDNVPQQLYPNATAGYYIGYVTPGDANTRIIPFGGVALKYNGVDLTDANVKNGRYTAWLYNRLLKPQSGLAGLKLTFADAIRDQLRSTDATSGGGLFNDASFTVERFTDGGIVTLKP